MTVAFIVRENIEVTEALKKRLEKIITELVVNEWASTFMFTHIGAFDRVCYEIVTKLKKLFLGIQRFCVNGERNYDDRKVEYFSEVYEKYLAPSDTDSMSYETRDIAMVERCDVLVTYCDINYQLNAKWVNCTAAAMAHAWKKKKRIINLFETN